MRFLLSFSYFMKERKESQDAKERKETTFFPSPDTFPYPKYNDLVMQLGFREKYFKK